MPIVHQHLSNCACGLCTIRPNSPLLFRNTCNKTPDSATDAEIRWLCCLGCFMVQGIPWVGLQEQVPGTRKWGSHLCELQIAAARPLCERTEAHTPRMRWITPGRQRGQAKEHQIHGMRWPSMSTAGPKRQLQQLIWIPHSSHSPKSINLRTSLNRFWLCVWPKILKT